MTLNINGKDYRIRFGYNCFCDSDLLDRVKQMVVLFSTESAKDDKDVESLGKIKDLFLLVRELIFMGCQKYNPLDSVQEVGDLLDDYIDEAPEGEERGIMTLFTELAQELMSKGFLGDMTAAAKSQPTKKLKAVK